MKARGYYAQRGILFLAAMCMWGPGMAQTFQVVGKTGDSYLSLDETHYVTYLVELTNSSTLTNVVPELVPPECGEVAVGPDMVNIFDTSYIGYKSGVSWVEGPIPSWEADTVKEVAFYIHLFDNPPQHSICTDLCVNGVRFGLRFTADSFSFPLAAGSSPYLDMTRPTSNVMGLTARATEYYEPIGLIPFLMPFDWRVDTFQFDEDPLDPEVRIYMMFDWNANTTNLASVFEFYYYPLKDYCGVRMDNAFFNGLVSLFDGVLYDETDTLPSGPGGLITQAPLGGAGTQNDPLGEGMNFWDITDLPGTCGGTVRSNLGYTPGNTYFANIDLSNSAPPCVMRDAAIFLGRPRECSAVAFAFGSPTSSFHFNSLDIDSQGNIAAEVNVPALWQSGGDLSGDYTIEWFLRSKNTFVRLTDINSDGVKITLETSAAGWLFGENFLEARVRHTVSGSYVSVESPIHGMYYTQQQALFANAEFPTPDEYLDPGETMTVPITMNNQSGETATNITVSVGYELGAGVDLITDASVPSTVLANGTPQDAAFDFELLQVPAGCQEVMLFGNMSHQRDNFTTSFTQYFSVTTNCQDTLVTFSDLEDWVPKSDGWAFDSETSTWSCQAQDASTTYILESPNGHPDAIVGSDPEFSIDHTFAFDLNQAGGVLEYATSSDGVNWSAWQDLVLEIEDGQGVQLYHPLPFPNTIPSAIADRRVFMSLDPPEQQNFQDYTVDPSGFPTFKGEKVRFRALFQAPYLDQSRGLIQTWDISRFDFTSTQPRPDTLFAIPRNMNFISCLPISLPVGHQGTYELRWFGDQSEIQDALYCLYNDCPSDIDPNFSGSSADWVDFPQPQTQQATYFLKMFKYDTQEIRIIPFTVTVPQGNVPTRSYMLPHWSLEPADAESDLNQDDQVDILDFTIRENEDVCGQPR